jgi:hypothetical protein
MTLSISIYAERRSSECRIFVVMLSVVILNFIILGVVVLDVAIILNVIIISAVMTSVIGLNVAVEIVLAPFFTTKRQSETRNFFKKFSNVLK